MEWLAIWGVGQATWFVFRPILENLATDVAKDIGKSYVVSCFKSVFSPIYRKPLAVATGRALKELLELIQNELLDADLDRDQLQEWVDDVRRFVEREEVRSAIASLFLDPDFHLDPAALARAWQRTGAGHSLPDEFSWERVAKRFARKAVEIRQASKELQETFASLASVRTSGDVKQLAGLPPEFDLESYREALIERFGSLHFEPLDTTGAYYSGVRLWSVFVPQSARECHEYYPQWLEIPKEQAKRLVERGELDPAALAESEEAADLRRREYFGQPVRPVLQVTDEAALARTVILGDPGSGKSSLLRFLALRWARIEDANLRYTQPLPLLIDLRDYGRWQCQGAKDFPKFLHEASTWHRLNQVTLDQLLREPGRVVLLLDGLDEVFDPALREEVVNDVHRFSNQYRHTRVIVTSRVVGYRPERLRDAEFRHFMLQDFTPEQVEAFIGRWHDVTFDDAADAALKGERLRRAIRDSRPIAELAGNPLLLTMMAILNRNQELPRDRADLYQQAARVLLHQWDTERALEAYPELRGQVGLREKTDILRRVAFEMQSAPQGLAGNFIDGERLKGLVEDYLHAELHFEQARAAAHAVVRQLRERNFILCFVGGDSYAFVHRTFLEYFCATEFVHRFNVAKTLDIEGLVALFDQHCRDDDWREVLRLICGQIDEVFVGRLVEHLATRTDLENWDGREPLPELPLAIWCLSEVRSTARLEGTGEQLLAAALQCFLRGKFPPEQFVRDLVASAREVGPNWPGKSRVDCVSQYPKSSAYHHHRLWPHFIAAVFPDRSAIERFAKCESWDVRRGAIEVLAEMWPDETTRNLLSERALQDEEETPRSAAIEALVEKWPDEATRKLLSDGAFQADNQDVRRAAIETLAEKWPDEATRKLLSERAVQDEGESTRGAALRALAEKWPDEATRKLLTERAVQDEGESARGAALRKLAEKWPDEATRKLLSERAVQDGLACSLLGGVHSQFGRILPTKDLFGWGPYLDPRKGFSREHIERAAEKAGIAADQIEATVRSLSEHFGWDITRGSAAG